MPTLPGMRVYLDASAQADLRTHAREALPREACGLLAASPAHSRPPETDLLSARLVRYLPMTNHAPAADRFAMDPVAVVRTESAIREMGLRLGGVFHSHPNGPAALSADDRARAWPDLVQLILSVPDAKLTAWIASGSAWQCRGIWQNRAVEPSPARGLRS